MPAIAKPESQLKRPRARKGKDQQATVIGQRRPVTIPPADPDWHPIAKGLYDSAMTSGQSDYYQDSDWWSLWNLCEEISTYKQMGYSYIDKETGQEVFVKKRSGQLFQAIMSNMTTLLLTEGDRRKVRMELQEPPKVEANLALVAELDLYRDVANGS